MSTKKLSPTEKQKIEFVFESGVLQENFYTQKIHSNIRKLNKLFRVIPHLIVVHAFKNRTSFLNAINKKRAPDWFVACVPPKSTSDIYIYSGANKLATNKVASQVLLHEITHIYTNLLNPNLPDWLKEGISVYVAAQIFKPSISIEDWERVSPEDIPFKSVSWRFAAEHNGYNIAGLLVMSFVRRYGWANFITAISYRRAIRFSIKSIPTYFGEKLERLMVDFRKQFVK